MKWCIETQDNEVIEVTNLYDKYGKDTTSPALAETCVLKFFEDQWASTRVLGMIHTVH